MLPIKDDKAADLPGACPMETILLGSALGAIVSLLGPSAKSMVDRHLQDLWQRETATTETILRSFCKAMLEFLDAKP